MIVHRDFAQVAIRLLTSGCWKRFAEAEVHSEALAVVVQAGAELDVGKVEAEVEGRKDVGSLMVRMRSDEEASLRDLEARLVQDRQLHLAGVDSPVAKDRQQPGQAEDGLGMARQGLVVARLESW